MEPGQINFVLRVVLKMFCFAATFLSLSFAGHARACMAGKSVKASQAIGAELGTGRQIGKHIKSNLKLEARA